jgi:hypothetical protein
MLSEVHAGVSEGRPNIGRKPDTIAVVRDEILKIITPCKSRTAGLLVDDIG